MQDYQLGRLNGEFVLVYYDKAGKRHRYRLGTDNARTAELRAPGIYAELVRPTGKTCQELWDAFVADYAGRAVVANMASQWKALQERFGRLPGDAIAVEDCRAYVAERRAAGIVDGTIHTELGRLRMVLNWAVKQKLLPSASYLERPQAPKRKENYLTREEVRLLIEAAEFPHSRLWIILAIGTGARTTAILQLTWERCDFERGLIDLRNPEITRPHKGRAIVPMNRTVKAALLESKAGALSAFVIEWAGQPIGSIKQSLHSAGRRAGLGHVTPHMLRHSAAVHMAEAGVAMEEIAQFLGHDDVETTRRIYARYSPTYLREAASALEYDDLGAIKRHGRG